MIARDEERMLPGCLDSVKGLVDEVVLVDTGSRDATREIAQGRGARVYARDWDDDFAAPRNLAIERATGDWILVLDADERLVPAGFTAIRRAVKRRDIDLGLLRLHDAARAEATAAEVLEGAARLGEPNLVPRLLRRTPDLRYRGIVHEEVAEWLAARKGGLDAVDADIVHLGGVPALREARGKRERNVLLLEKRCRLEPGSVVPMGYLAMEYWKSGRFGEARAVAERAWQMIDAQPAHRSAFLVGVVRAFSQVKEEDEAGLRETLARMVGREGVRRDFSFLAGVAEELRALRRVGRDRREPLEAAVAAYRGLTGTALPPEERGCIEGAAGWGARIRAGTALLQLGRTGEAQEEFQAALAAVPGNEEAILGAAESALDLGDAAGALERLAPLLAGGHERPDGWMLAAAASVLAAGSGEVVSGLLARAQALESRGFVASHRAARLTALCAPARADLASSLLAALMEGRPVPAEAVGRPVGEAVLRAVARTLLRSGRASLLERLLTPAAAAASPGLPERMRAILEEAGSPAAGGEP
jgi:tetratricopeptide (TPR) repeat protein